MEELPQMVTAYRQRLVINEAAKRENTNACLSFSVFIHLNGNTFISFDWNLPTDHFNSAYWCP